MAPSSERYFHLKRWLAAWVALCLLFVPVLPYAAMLSVAPVDHQAMQHAQDVAPCHMQRQQQADECAHCDRHGPMLECQCMDHFTSSQINSTLDYLLLAYFAFADTPQEMTAALPASPLYPKDKPPRTSPRA